MERQKTIGREIKHAGIGLHTGNETIINFKPAPPDSGVKFVRIDLPDRPVIPGDIDHVIDVARGTTLGEGEVKIHTVEHVLAALAGLGIDNLIVEINANEPPVVDGSALPFMETLNKAGIVEQDKPKRFFEIAEPVYLAQGDVMITIFPHPSLRISFTIDYNHPALKSQFCSFEINEEVFQKEIAPARTFCFLHEVESLQEQGLIKGGSLDNAIVIGDESIPVDTLRYETEFVRHKVLDLLGDFYLLGLPIKGHIIALKSGHDFNVQMVRRLKRLWKKTQLAAIHTTEGNLIGQKKELDIEEIQKIIPHRYPFLLIDKIIETDGDKRIVGLKNISLNESFFEGHFPGQPVMPGVLVVESMAQTAGVLLLSKPENKGKLAYFMGIDGVRFRQPIAPGDQLRIEVEVERVKSKTGKVKAVAMVDGKIACEADLMFAFV